MAKIQNPTKLFRQLVKSNHLNLVMIQVKKSIIETTREAKNGV